jgi:hypothetical protein
MKLVIDVNAPGMLILVDDDDPAEAVLRGPGELAQYLRLGGLSGTAVYVGDMQVLRRSHCGYYGAGTVDLAAATGPTVGAK